MTKIENISAVAAKLSLKEQILELLMPDLRYFTRENGEAYPVTTLPVEIEQVLQEYPFGGIILFRENLAKLDEIIQLTDKLQQHTKSGRLIAIDQEGGSVTRIHSATEMPGNMALGAIDDILTTAQASQVLATELAALGFNFMFSPVLDVNSNPQNPIVGVRSFGKDPELVARHGVAYCDGLNRVNLIACGKHFPGHGDTDSDSHHALPIISKSVAEFTQVDLLPFKVAFDANIDSIMTAHIVFSNLDASKIESAKTGSSMPTPATLSKTILTDLLRNKMNYKGVVVSDALDMKAIADNFTPVEATLKCIEAGVDIVLMPIRLWSNENISDFHDYMRDLIARCEKSEFLQQRVFESCCRVLELKQRKVMPKLMAQVSFAERVNAMHEVVLSPKHHQLQQEIAAKAVTLARNSTNTLPWIAPLNEAILVVVANDAVADDAKNALSALGYSNLRIKNVLDDIAKSDLSSIDKVLLLTYNLNTDTAQPFNTVLKLVKSSGIPYVVVNCHNPYDDLYLDDIDTSVLVFGCSGLDQTNYSIRKFELNMLQAIKKIMTAQHLCDFNHHSPV